MQHFCTCLLALAQSSSSTNINTRTLEKSQCPVIRLKQLSSPQCLIENAYGWWCQHPPVQVKASWTGCWKPPGAPRGGGADRASDTLRRDPLSTCCENCLSQTVSPTFQIRLGIMSHKSFCHLSAPVVSLPLWHNDHCVLLICCHKTRRDWAYMCELGKVRLLSFRFCDKGTGSSRH